MVLVLLAVSVIIFALVRITPSDPVASMTQGKSVSEETKQELREHYHLDKSAPEQYIIWVTGIFKGDLGESYQYKQSVGFLIGERIGTTMTLVLLSGVLAILIAIPVGVISAVKMNTWIDKLLSVITLIFVASPVFLTALVLMLVFALKLRWFPAIYQGNGLKEMILPAIALALITKEVYSSLFIGILVGGLLYSNFAFEGTLVHVFSDGIVSVLSDSYNVGILIFLVILGTMVCLMNKAGGSKDYGDWAVSDIKTKSGALWAA